MLYKLSSKFQRSRGEDFLGKRRLRCVFREASDQKVGDQAGVAGRG